MKRVIIVAATLLAIFAVVSCKNNTQKRIVSDVPIKSEVLGLKLCSVTDEEAVEETLYNAASLDFIADSQKNGVGTVVRAFPTNFNIPYGGLGWTYVDVSLNEKNEIVAVSLVASYESIERAEEQFNKASQIFTNKYGKPNLNEEFHNAFWTDNTNSVGLTYSESAAINGSNRSFCTLYYVNRALSDALDKANTPDI